MHCYHVNSLCRVLTTDMMHPFDTLIADIHHHIQHQQHPAMKQKKFIERYGLGARHEQPNMNECVQT